MAVKTKYFRFNASVPNKVKLPHTINRTNNMVNANNTIGRYSRKKTHVVDPRIEMMLTTYHEDVVTMDSVFTQIVAWIVMYLVVFAFHYVQLTRIESETHVHHGEDDDEIHE